MNTIKRLLEYTNISRFMSCRLPGLILLQWFCLLFLAPAGYGAYSDLTFVNNSISVSPNPVKPGQNLTVSVSIKNIGSVNAAGSTTRLQIKNGLLAKYADQDYATPAIPVGVTTNQSYIIIVTPSTPVGSYNAYLVLDRYGTAGQNNNDTANDYGSSDTFTVADKSIPIIDIRPATSVDSGSAILNARITDNGGSPIVEWRFSWGTTESCSDGSTMLIGGVVVNGNDFLYHFQELPPKSKYYFQAWAKNSTGWGNSTAASFTTTDQVTYNVNASASEGGSVNPSGNNMVEQGQSIIFTAQPDSTHVVDQWFLDGIYEQTGGTSLTIIPNKDTTIQVSFKLKTYRLLVSAAHGQVTVAPDLTEYPHGGEVTLTATADANCWLYDWRGDVTGVGNILKFRITKDTSVLAYFITIPTAVSMQIANSTPATTFNINLPAAPDLLHVLQSSQDFVAWSNLKVMEGNTSSTLAVVPGNLSKEFYRCADVQKISTEPFLIFPITNKSKGTVWTSRNTPVSSIFDHQLPGGGMDKVIKTYRGQTATLGLNNGWHDDAAHPVSIDSTKTNFYGLFTVVGYARDTEKDLPLGFNYTDNNIYWYDGHNGIDYAVGTTEDVVAACEGDIVLSESVDCYNAICIDNGHGYRTYYLHLSERASDLMANGNLQARHVMAGQIIGKPGNTSCKGGIGVHLHFEVKRTSCIDGIQSWVPIDPYGEYAINDQEVYSQLWINGQ